MNKYFNILLAAGLVLSGILSGPAANAQYYSAGDDPGTIKWMTIKTAHYRIVYPYGIDSLAREYAVSLESFYDKVGVSSGYRPGERYRRPTPVILHPYFAAANGSVSWAPRTMDLYTFYDHSAPEPIPNEKLLALHESRHVSQMQFGRSGLFTGFHYIFGESFAGAMSAVYPSPAFLEGDAVTAETGLSESGRGRTADFLKFYQMALYTGDRRDWYQWRYGSLNKYTPDYYRAGYMAIAGTRYFFDDPLFTQRYFRSVSRKPWKLGNFQRNIKQASGMKFRDSWNYIQDGMDSIWRAEALEREPFTQIVPVTRPRKEFTVYGAFESYGDGFVATRAAVDRSTELVLVSADGSVKVLKHFSSSPNRLALDSRSGILYWAESVPDPRWTLSMTSAIRSLDLAKGKMRTLAKDGRYVNPTLSEDGRSLVCIEYPVEGGSLITTLDSSDGSVLDRFCVPGRLQATEAVPLAGKTYFSAVSDNGIGIYSVKDGTISTEIEPLTVKINRLRAHGGKLWFVSDRNGSNEIYSYAPESGDIRQVTSIRFGVSEYTFKGDSLFITGLSPAGNMIYAAKEGMPEEKPVDFRVKHLYPVAEALSRQEKELREALAENDGISLEPAEIGISDPVRYHKFPHLLRFHSWMPLSVEMNSVKNISADEVLETTKLGASAMFQNDLGTMQGSLGLSVGPQVASHLDLRYSGLYPVLEASLDYGDHESSIYRVWNERSSNGSAYYTDQSSLGKNNFTAELLAYIPFNFSSGGWSRGLIPQVSYKFSNDRFCKDIVSYVLEKDRETDRPAAPENYDFTNLHIITAKLRGYRMLYGTQVGIYPRLGISAEAGVRTQAGLGKFYSPVAYAYTYGYVPGLTTGHGIRLSASYQHQFKDDDVLFGQSFFNIVPRGFAETAIANTLSIYTKDNLKLTFDYAMPIFPVDWSFLCPVAYIKNFQLIPFADFFWCTMDTKLRGPRGALPKTGNLVSAGTDFSVVLSNVAWVPFEGSIGVRVAYNGGNAYDIMQQIGKQDFPRVYVGLVSNFSL